ncbi:histidine phosphatase family protein [uncultured Tateyamaria sp.]|uniref:histidine phosphatase family protein n=1 Tax=uncultured Tateyamaria sp. TaxID=455651 RepID=UPI002614117E|nr:histidine phosphatase family protein [uncultured Tateyamaria sp.]
MAVPRQVLRYLSHPQVEIDPAVPVPDWPLNAVGHARVAALAQVARDRLGDSRSVFSSPERKARDAAMPLAQALGLSVSIAEDSGEIDRSATGFLHQTAFEATADAFFAQPDQSVDGWERATDAQNRILNSIHAMISRAPDGDMLVIGHGAVGTLLFCACARLPISRAYDQAPGGGGNVLEFDRETLEIKEEWVSMERYFHV